MEDDCKQIEAYLKKVLFKTSCSNIPPSNSLTTENPDSISTQNSNEQVIMPVHTEKERMLPNLNSLNSCSPNNNSLNYMFSSELEMCMSHNSGLPDVGKSPAHPLFHNELDRQLVGSSSVQGASWPAEETLSQSVAPQQQYSKPQAFLPQLVENIQLSGEANLPEVPEASKTDLALPETALGNGKPELKRRERKKKKNKLKRSAKKKEKHPAEAHKETPRAARIRIAHDSDNTDSAMEEVAIPFNPNVEPGSIRSYIFQKSKQNNWSFYCEVCEYSALVDSAMVKHATSSNHKRKVEQAEADLKLADLPDPLPAQITFVDETIRRIALSYGLPEINIVKRQQVADRVNNLVSASLQDCSIQLVGSSVTGLGLKKGEVDLVLKVPSSTNASDMLAETHQLLLKDKKTFHRVISEFKEKIPRIQFEDIENSFNCNLTINTGCAAKLTKLMQFYVSLDPRVIVLGKALRFWAELCDIDKPDRSTLPSICYPILLVYFLQQEKPPVLPVLHEQIGPKLMEIPDLETFKKEFKWQSKNDSPIGLLWIRLLQYYSIKYQPGRDVVCLRILKKVTCRDRSWGTKFFAIEDPFTHRNLAHVIPNRTVFRYVHGCFVNTYRHFAYPRLKNSGALPLAVRDTPPCSRLNCHPTYDTSTTLSGTADASSQGTDDDSFNAFDMGETDPDLNFHDVASTISKMVLNEASSDNVTCPRNCETSDAMLRGRIRSTSANSHVSSMRSDDCSSDRIHEDEAFRGTPTSTCSWDDKSSLYYWDSGGKDVTQDMLLYDFSARVFMDDLVLPLICRVCQKAGHLKADCPSEQLPLILPLPPMTPDYLHLLNRVCVQIRDCNKPSATELMDREHDRSNLLHIIQETYPEADLEMFGSFCNGFGFSKSDVDFCLTFHDSDGKELNQCEIIECLASKLKKHKRYANVVAITSAKVPIVKLYDKQSGLENDISLYNTLGQRNTKMLDTYCKIDERVEILGYVFKYFAKTLDICDASRGSLSSYAYILMVVFFLQQRTPPVLPVLQELYEGDEKPVDEVDGWNAWFFDDIKRLPEVWPDYDQNKESVAELWLGLLNFYVVDFKMDEFVITIKQKEPLSRFRKLWNSKKIAIEDPFDLNHNLGSGLSRKMNNFIMKALICGREHFGTPKTGEFLYHANANGAVGYLFDRQVINKGCDPPKDRGCRFCGKIGHVIKDCPLKLQAQKKKDKTVGRRERHEAERKSLEVPLPRGVRPNMHAKNRTPPQKTPPRLAQPMPKSAAAPERAPPPGFPPNVLPPATAALPRPQHFSTPPPGFQNPLPPQQQQRAVPVNMQPYFMLAPQQQQQPFFNMRPAMSHPFPSATRPAEPAYSGPSHSSPHITYSQPTWPAASSQIDKITNEQWQHIPQVPLSQAQVLANNLGQAVVRPNFMQVNAALPPQFRNTPDRPRTSSDPMFYHHFQGNR